MVDENRAPQCAYASLVVGGCCERVSGVGGRDGARRAREDGGMSKTEGQKQGLATCCTASEAGNRAHRIARFERCLRPFWHPPR